MTSPYRELEDKPLLRFQLRTQRVWGEAYGSAAFILVIVLLLVAAQLTMSGVIVLVVLALVAPTIWVWQRSSYRVAGGSGELLIFREHIELPHARRAEGIRMALDELQIEMVHRKVWFNGISFDEAVNIILHSGRGRRVLAAAVFESDERARAAYEALQLAKAGRLQSEGAERLEQASPSVRDGYDDELDRMLAALDD